MSTYIDAILHIADLPALAAALMARDPRAVSPSGAITGFDATPAVRNGTAALVYVRMTVHEAAVWRGTPGVTILAEAPYGPDVADVIYAALFANPTAKAMYDAVYPRPVISTPEGDVQPPERFGMMG